MRPRRHGLALLAGPSTSPLDHQCASRQVWRFYSGLSSGCLALLRLMHREMYSRWNIRKVPRAQFSLQLTPPGRERKRIASMLQQDLSSRFGVARILHPLILAFLPVTWITLDVQGKGIMIGLRRRRAPVDTPKKYLPIWDLIIEPVASGMSVKPMLGGEKEWMNELRIVSGHLHQLLLRTPGVTSLCWSFVGWRQKDQRISPVRTPAELPWD